jgi:hypothetical protein
MQPEIVCLSSIDDDKISVNVDIANYRADSLFVTFSEYNLSLAQGTRIRIKSKFIQSLTPNLFVLHPGDAGHPNVIPQLYVLAVGHFLWERDCHAPAQLDYFVYRHEHKENEFFI